MANDLAIDDEQHVLCDVRAQVRDTLDRARHREHVDHRSSGFDMLGDLLDIQFRVLRYWTGAI